MSLFSKIKAKLQNERNNRKAKFARSKLGDKDISIISQNCIGGIFSHDMQWQFRSPTVNLYIPAKDYMKFVQELERYLAAELTLERVEQYPVGRLGDIEVHFVHYNSWQEAKAAWERRKARVNWDRILILSTDRDGFDEQVFEQWKALPYPKLLFTANKKYSNHPDSLDFPQYEELGCVPDLIPKREFYKDDVLINKVNAIGGRFNDSVS